MKTFDEYNRAMIVTGLALVARDLRTGVITEKQFDMNMPNLNFGGGCIGCHLAAKLGMTPDDAEQVISLMMDRDKFTRHPLRDLFWEWPEKWNPVTGARDREAAANRIDAWINAHGRAEDLVS